MATKKTYDQLKKELEDAAEALRLARDGAIETFTTEIKKQIDSLNLAPVELAAILKDHLPAPDVAPTTTRRKRGSSITSKNGSNQSGKCIAPGCDKGTPGGKAWFCKTHTSLPAGQKQTLIDGARPS